TLRWFVALVGSGRASDRSSLETSGRAEASASDLLDGLDRHRLVLRCRFDVGPTHSPDDSGILALVGDSPVGGRLLRGLCHHRNRLLLLPTESRNASVGGGSVLAL